MPPISGLGLVVLLIAHLLPVYASPRSFPSPAMSVFQTRQDPNPFDHSDILRHAHVGDSFSSGIGAGSRFNGLYGWYCSQYDGSWGYVLNKWKLGTTEEMKADVWACSGHTADTIRDKQVTQLKDKTYQLITMTAGGNDVGFSDLLNSCIFRWSFRADSCPDALSKASAAIESAEFAGKLDRLLEATKKKLDSPDARIVIPEYPVFFDASTTQCDSVSWHVRAFFTAYLTRDKRSELNQLVVALNRKLKEAIARAGTQVVYVEWNGALDDGRARYCEPRVKETAADHDSAAFYYINTAADDSDELTIGPDAALLANGSDSLTQANPSSLSAQITRWIKQAKEEDPSFRTEIKAIDHLKPNSGNIISDNIGRVFHPQPYGHMLMADAVLQALSDDKAKRLGMAKAPRVEIDTCPIRTGPATHYGAHGKCFADDGNEEPPVVFSVSDANTAIRSFCRSHAHDQVVAGEGTLSRLPNGNKRGQSIALRVSLDTTPACQHYPNLGRMDLYYCADSFSSAMNDCDTSTIDSKVGGVHVSDCITYSISGSRLEPLIESASPTSTAPKPTGVTCTLNAIPYGTNKASCRCSDGSKPEPQNVKGRLQCPNQVGVGL